MFRVKSCPRCAGDLYLQNSTGIYEWTCEQCGHSSPACVTTSTQPSNAELKDLRFDNAADADLRADPSNAGRTKAPARRQAGLSA